MLPFYPIFFLQRFGIDSGYHVGAYLAVLCFVVMVSFPFWAKLAKRYHEIHIWIFTQIIAAALGIACYYSTSIEWLWIVSMTKMVFKASYLLIYPYALRLEEKDAHLGIVGLFAVLMHFGGIGGAILGGVLIDVTEAHNIYLIMSLGDVIQVLICIYLSIKLNLEWKQLPYEEHVPSRKKIPTFIFTLGLVSLIVYFCEFLARPYFTLYWQQISQSESTLIAGLVYAVPAWMALFGLLVSHGRWTSKLNAQQQITAALLAAAVGLCLQAIADWYVVLAGRILFGYALFIITVKLEVMLFSLSEPAHYAEDFSKIHFLQSTGIIGASVLIGSLVSEQDFSMPFVFAAGGMVITCLLFIIFFIFKQTNDSATNDSHVSSITRSDTEIH
ncbi:MFS transporter [Veronia pacifica]|nr:MFS transporter [Veronia pacifica]